MPKVLLTAFEPFNGQTLNPSQEALRALQSQPIPGLEIEGLELPVERFAAIEIALMRIQSSRPDVIILLGEGGRRFRVTPERVAINVDDYPIPDNRGMQPRNEPIIPDGPVGYFSSLPIQNIVDRLTAAHIPAGISNSAGTYLCNRLFYSVMHWLALEGSPARAGFIHLPFIHEQTVHERLDFPSLSRETVIEAVRLAIEVTAKGA
jgi:pyroglutamyl-peptidase